MGLLLLFGACTDAAAQHDPKMVQDTSRAWRRNPQPPATPQDRPPASWLKTDTAVYNNDLYWKGIRSAEYQNRGAEDRRNPLSTDPNAIPNKQVPYRPVLPDSARK